MKYLVLVLCLTLSFMGNAQNVKVGKDNFKVKGERVFSKGKDVTETLSAEKKSEIKKAVQLQQEASLAKQQALDEKNAKKEVKKQKAAEKKRKKAEKAEAKKEKAQANFEKANRNLEKAKAKRAKLLERGKLSPIEEAKADVKIKALEEKVAKAKKKLK